MESIRNSFDKLSRSTKSSMSNKQSMSNRGSISNKPSQTKLSPLETLIDTPVNSFTSRGSTPKPAGLAAKSTKFAAETYNNTLSFFNAKNYIFIFGFIMVLALFGINIFTYLSQATNYITGLVGPMFSTSGNVLGDTTKSIINNTSAGTQQILDVGSNTTQQIIDVGSDTTQRIIDVGSNTTKNIVDATAKGTTSGIDYLQGSLKKNVSAVKPENNNPTTNYVNKPVAEPDPSNTSSSSQGYCYIGNINDARHCAKVNTNDQCMSGDIYPTMDICINPNIKA
ncbi:hypothetical protein PGAG_00273 [Phaeocystis globosa virus 12T]|uniref:Uncharacterized protein n=1 Tax=Phaeocystis globosa virus PgV-16T TaxID=3071227 RepID=A0AC59EXC6_9VIRU|nr:hypothetical protein PGCG_00312 [Phaeocystis globosa virus]AET73162.1 hypothetical protein PGAG_00273 [Phaeocystis globosa virus 12T]AET73986.1 hypothetical protein PGBG_00278 [Phaeocystis globosa virus 14T]AGM15623.1 hypothetical protein PGCG_00312 [Phaeocystis globosa virus PgV-16T]UYE94353.1 hypothetical protein PGV14T_00312 [Phaeocystis globosa virus]